MVKKINKSATVVCKNPIKRTQFIFICAVIFSYFIFQSNTTISTNTTKVSQKLESLNYRNPQYSTKRLCRGLSNYIENPKNETISSNQDTSCKYMRRTKTECLGVLNIFEVSDEWLVLHTHCDRK